MIMYVFFGASQPMLQGSQILRISEGLTFFKAKQYLKYFYETKQVDLIQEIGTCLRKSAVHTFFS